MRPANRTATITRDLGEGPMTLRLGIGEIIQLEEVTGSPVASLFMRIMSQAWGVKDVMETIRLGLIGGGMVPPLASITVTRLIQPGWLDWYWPIATEIVHAAVQGAPDDDLSQDDEPGES